MILNICYLLANHCRCQLQHQRDIAPGWFRRRMHPPGEIGIEEWQDAGINISSTGHSNSLHAAFGTSVAYLVEPLVINFQDRQRSRQAHALGLVDRGPCFVVAV